MSMQNLGAALAKQLVSLREQKGMVAFEDLGTILEKAANTMNEGHFAVDAFLRDEIIKIASHIESTKNEIIALAPESLTENGENTTAMQLYAVIKTTEAAAQDIMDAADEIQKSITASSVEQTTKDNIFAITSRIYEACNFQDLTGQRIKKIMDALEYTEGKIRRLTGLFGSDGSVDLKALKEARGETPDQHLLNGPQLPGDAPSQADIDALFDDLK